MYSGVARNRRRKGNMPGDQRFRCRLEDLQGDVEASLDRIDHAIIDEDIEHYIGVARLIFVQHAR